MATRQRILYASKAVSVAGVTLPGVQSCTYGFELARTDVHAFGKMAVHDRLLTTTPTVTVEIQKLAESGGTRGAIALKTEMISNATATAKDVAIGLDNSGSDPDHGDFTGGAGNIINCKSCYVSSATAEASVGAFALVTVGYEGTGVASTATIATPGTAAASPQEKVNIGNKFSGGIFLQVTGTAQSVNMTVNITREVLEKFHQRFSAVRLIQFPLTATMTQEGIALNNNVNFTQAIAYSEASAGLTSPDFLIDGKKFGLTGAIADSITFNGGIGDNHTVSCVYSASVGSLGDTTHNFGWWS